jgi:acid stress-induced BolA-like protein IbaG/YrbA
VLAEALEADASDVEEISKGGRVGGVVVSARFSGIDQVDRQRLVWGALRQGLDPEQLLAIGLLMTLTPSEFNAVREG